MTLENERGKQKREVEVGGGGGREREKEGEHKEPRYRYAPLVRRYGRGPPSNLPHPLRRGKQASRGVQSIG